MAVLGGCSERVSAVKFPDLRENTGNLVGIRPSGDAGRQPAQGIAGGIPYQAEQGNIGCEQGTFSQQQGPPSPLKQMSATAEIAGTPSSGIGLPPRKSPLEQPETPIVPTTLRAGLPSSIRLLRSLGAATVCVFGDPEDAGAFNERR